MTKMNWLLDLNYTLVSNNNPPYPRPFSARMRIEEYREWLLDLLQDYGGRIILITARPQHQAAETLQNIRKKTGWQPHEAYWNTRNERPEIMKPRVLTSIIMPKYGTNPSDYMAVESNARTRAAYKRMGITSIPAPRGAEQWAELPIPLQQQKLL